MQPNREKNLSYPASCKAPANILLAHWPAIWNTTTSKLSLIGQKPVTSTEQKHAFCTISGVTKFSVQINRKMHSSWTRELHQVFQNSCPKKGWVIYRNCLFKVSVHLAHARIKERLGKFHSKKFQVSEIALINWKPLSQRITAFNRVLVMVRKMLTNCLRSTNFEACSKIACFKMSVTFHSWEILKAHIFWSYRSQKRQLQENIYELSNSN